MIEKIKIFHLEIKRCEECFYYYNKLIPFNYRIWEKICTRRDKNISFDELIPDWCPLPDKVENKQGGRK